MALDSRKWLESHHPIYDANIEQWQKNEARMRGGAEILDDLSRFDWEQEKGEHYKERQKNAVYLNFPDRFATVMVGHMMRQAPEVGNRLSFGTLGEVRRIRDVNTPTPAELVYYNTDGVGNDGSQWNNFWTRAAKASFACGFRWIIAEGPETPPQNFQDAINGRRPFLSHLSPTSVTNWDFVEGQLGFAIIKRAKRVLRLVTDNDFTNNMENEYLVMVRRGYDALGSEFVNGGWFTFDKDGILGKFGSFQNTRGEIPMVAMFYERVDPDSGGPNIARPGVTELGQAAIAYMNLASAADYDAWDGASTVRAVIGADDDAFNVFIRKIKAGNRYAPIPPNKDGAPQQQVQIEDISSGAIAGNVFDLRLKAKRQEAMELMLNELQAAPYASGESKKISFTDSRAPRLSMLASELETAQNTMIHFLELMWGNPLPSGSVEWEREFDLLNASAAVNDYFTIEQLAGFKSPTAGTKAMMQVVKALGIVGDDATRTTIEKEFQTSAETAQKLAEQSAKAAIQAQQAKGNPASGGTPAKPQDRQQSNETQNQTP